MNTMNSLLQYFNNNTENAIHKWTHYFDIYDTHFSKYRNKPVTILEIGVYQGGSLNMWKNYFGKDAQIFAIDINPECKQFEAENIKIFIGSQEDPEFLSYVKTQMPKVDILIDDGGHSMRQQIVSFEELYDHVKDDGIYFIEDLHSSYWSNYGGGYKNPTSFIEYSKNFIDYLNAWHSHDKELMINEFTRTAYSLHYYDSILIIEKRKITPPESKMTGKVIIDIDKFVTGLNRESNAKNEFKIIKFFKTLITKKRQVP
ncbi:MAG: class I SAM-dependent methyltransferase [Bacteroidales bacterium]|nr:class I SAM-dependent methyltransferase [Bacteroidales bacterium]